MPKPSAWTPDKTERLRELHAQGKNAHEIAVDLASTYLAVYSKLEMIGLRSHRSTRFRSVSEIAPDTRERVVALARLGHSQQTIADQFGLKKYDVQRIAAQAGVEWKLGRRFGKARA